MIINEILQYPITTNRVVVRVDLTGFLDKYSVISYYDKNKVHKNRPYEQLANIPVLSVAGVKAMHPNYKYPGVKFFVMTSKEDSQTVLETLRVDNEIVCSIETFDLYEEELMERVIASLAINSLGMNGHDNRIYSNGSLLICDSANFHVKKKKGEELCLEIAINEYMNLSAKTRTLAHPISSGELGKHINRVFKKKGLIGGEKWTGQPIRSVVVDLKSVSESNLSEYYIQKKNYNDSMNIIPYWPFDPQKYQSGKLFALSQVVDSVNEKFSPYLNIDFQDYPVICYEEYKGKEEMLILLQKFFDEQEIYIENPFKDKGSKKFVKAIKTAINNILGNDIAYSKTLKASDLLIQLCEDPKTETGQSYYKKSLERMANFNAIQHIIYHPEDEEQEFLDASARRILIEFYVKQALATNVMPLELANRIQGWEFYRYKNRKNESSSLDIIGAMMYVGADGRINVQSYGFDLYKPCLHERFVKQILCYDKPQNFAGAGEYYALKHNGNTYLIVDTEEIPILDVSAIDEGYSEVINNGTTINLFKRKKEGNCHKYLRGAMGLHLWKSPDMDNNPDAAYSYIAAKNHDSYRFSYSQKIDKMPRARRIYVLKKENQDAVDGDVKTIIEMLKIGFGRWNEIMTYPFPFKYLQEYLDNECLIAFRKHWGDVNWSSQLYN